MQRSSPFSADVVHFKRNGGGMGELGKEKARRVGRRCSRGGGFSQVGGRSAAEEGRLRRSRDVGSFGKRGARERSGERSEKKSAWLIHSRSPSEERGGAERRRWCTSRSSEEKEEVQ
ncbi:hypothetical protein Syun_024965 [Stephania yunnanensis]|uniref:Uncharacterized protein n=1 Tax=Stephania yunnanensis TaxID=152371 RepID=A0AAP0HVT1_9MAGN